MIIPLIFLIISVAAIVILVLRKIPEITSYNPPVFETITAIGKIKEKIKNRQIGKNIVPNELILLKVLSKTRVFVLKAENRLANWLKTLRQKSIEREKSFSDNNYWEQLKLKRKKAKKSDNDKHISNFTPLF